MKSLFTLVLICFGLLSCTAQKFKTIELKPIVRQGGVYYYDLKRVHGGAYGLQIPLQSLDDDEVNKYYKRFRGWRLVGIGFSVIPAVYIFSLSRNQFLNETQFWTVFGVSIVGGLACEVIAIHHIRKGIDRYNTLVLGVSRQEVGPSLTYKF